MKSSFRFFAGFLFAAFALSARAADDLKALGGTWKPTKAELAGQPMPPPVLTSITLRVDGASYEVTVETPKGKVVDKGTVAIEPAAKPRGMTVTGTDGPNAGKTFPAIYEFTADNLRICYDLSGAARPTDFKTAPGTKLYLVDYERVK